MTPDEKRLSRITKLAAHDAELLREGVSHESALARTLADLSMQVVADRMTLAMAFLDMGDVCKRSRHDLARSAISRYYYAMYHAMRAVSYSFFGGDDHEKHTELGDKGVPKDFPNRAAAKNDLRDARLTRNEADYEPYPSAPTYFKAAESRLSSMAHAFVNDARAYVRAKGNPYI